MGSVQNQKLVLVRCPSCGGTARELTTPEGAYALDCTGCGLLAAKLPPAEKAEGPSTLQGRLTGRYDRGYALMRAIEDLSL